MSQTATIDYLVNCHISVEQFVDLLKRSTLAERRPVDDLVCMEAMVANSNLCITAWSTSGQLVGVARSVTDFSYACFLSDLAVDEFYQGQGIGRRLVEQTAQQLGGKCKIRLIAAPGADGFYENIGFSKNERCWEKSC